MISPAPELHGTRSHPREGTGANFYQAKRRRLTRERTPARTIMSTSTNSLPSPKGRNSKLITSLAAKTDGRPQHKHYTKKINLSGQICHVHLNITRNGNFMVKIQMPDGSIRPFGSASFPNESYALAAASRAAQRIFDSNRKGG